MDSNKIGKFIAELRKSRSWTQSELASKLDVSDKTVSKWESGNGLPDITILPTLAKILGVTTDELLAGESKKAAPNESIFGKIAAGDLDLLEEIEKGLKYDGLDEYGKSLADYCAEKNNIQVFRLLFKLNKVNISNRTETRSNSNMRPGGKETLTYEDVLIYDSAYHTGKYDNPYPQNYSDSALVCLVLKNRDEEILNQLHLEKRNFNAVEANYIADDFDYFYKKYFVKEFPSHIGSIVCALAKRGKRNEAQKMLDIIPPYKQKMESKCADCEKESNRRYGGERHWTINWNTGRIHEPVYDKSLKKSLIMRDKIMAYCWGTSEQPYIIGNAIIFTQEELTDIGFAAPDVLTECKKLEYSPYLDEALIARLLEKDDIKIFEAFTAGEALAADLEKLILNANGKVKEYYLKLHTPQNISEAIVSDNDDLVMSMLAKPKDALRYAKEVALESLGTKEKFPILEKLIPFFDKRQLDLLLGEIVKEDNPKARVALIEAGAMLYSYNAYSEKVADKIQTEILYKLSKMEIKE